MITYMKQIALFNSFLIQKLYYILALETQLFNLLNRWVIYATYVVKSGMTQVPVGLLLIGCVRRLLVCEEAISMCTNQLKIFIK